MKDVSFLLAFAAGVFSFLSPCVLPLVPAYISYLMGSAVKDINTSKMKAILLVKSIGFIIGFSIIFIIMGASISFLGKFFAANRSIFRILGGILIIVFGIHTTGLLKIRSFYYEKRLLPFRSNISSVFIGMAFATGWTPCIGPILSSILIYSANMKTISEGILLLAVYSLGLGLPFILTAMAVGSLDKYLNRLTRHLHAISLISGILMIVMGILILFDKVYLLSYYLGFVNF